MLRFLLRTETSVHSRKHQKFLSKVPCITNTTLNVLRVFGELTFDQSFDFAVDVIGPNCESNAKKGVNKTDPLCAKQSCLHITRVSLS